MTFDLDYFSSITNGFDEVEPELVMAIAQAESALNPHTVRFEPGWTYQYRVSEFAKNLKITRETEKTLQMFSWGLMQIMGTVAREEGFDKLLTELTNPSYNIIIGCRKVESLQRIHEKLEDIISAYNQGWPKKNEDGYYKNQAYVDKVMAFYLALK